MREVPVVFPICLNFINKPSIGKLPILPVNLPHSATIQLGISGAHDANLLSSPAPSYHQSSQNDPEAQDGDTPAYATAKVQIMASFSVQ